MIEVHFCSSLNSTLFTDCCGCAICADENYCPKCKKEVLHGKNYGETDRLRWKQASKRWDVLRR